MANKKIMTPIELREAQEKRERETKDAQTRQQEEAKRNAEERVYIEAQKATDEIIRTWYDQVLSASQKNGIRFLVLAEVGEFDQRMNEIKSKIYQEIQTQGYSCTEVALEYPEDSLVTHWNSKPNFIDFNYVGEVWLFNEGIKGWKPKEIASFKRTGASLWLIVKW